MKTVILFGGSGYIGTAISEVLISKGYRVLNIDKHEPNEKLCEGEDIYSHISCDLAGDPVFELITYIEDIIEADELLGAIHLAAYKNLPESLGNAYIYYFNNINCVLSSVKVFNQFRSSNSKFIYSSSAAVYRDSTNRPLSERHKVSLNNPYGNSKLFGEIIVKDVSSQYKFDAVSLRYFNPIGSTKLSVDKSESMFSNIRNAIRLGSTFKVYGGDYDTNDGSCVRDFIDIRDLADAHIYFLENTIDRSYDVINVGTGVGTSVLEVVNTVKEMYPTFRYEIVGRREGDPSVVYADTRKMENYGFKTTRTLKDSLKTLKIKS